MEQCVRSAWFSARRWAISREAALEEEEEGSSGSLRGLGGVGVRVDSVFVRDGRISEFVVSRKRSFE
jgi:hypothetical protein